MKKIIPAIMPKSYEDLVEKIDRVAGFVDEVQIDVMDGVLVSSKSWPYENDPQGIFLQMINGQKRLPHAEKISFMVDLMISDVEVRVHDWIKAGVAKVVIHLNSLQVRDNAGFIQSLKADYPDLKVGIAIGTSEMDRSLEPFLPYVDFVQCMGIANVGYQNEPFDERVIEHVAYVKIRAPRMPIVVDGAVGLQTVKKLKKAGASDLVVGSDLFESENIQATYRQLTRRLRSTFFFL